MRIGIGQDSHSFSNISKPLAFGGVIFKKYIGLEGNSDGDVLIHSLCNALSSAIGGESISTWTDKMCLEEGITDSRQYLKYVFNLVSKNFIISNISIVVEAQIPRLLSKEKQLVKKSLSDILKIKLDQIGITYTSGEKLTSFGRKEGIQVFSTVLLSEK
ncbi:MAG: 2-C-methyl-D-erythritol 2,4-cyclodiphosphate synthase [Candidatus Shapirobacteria bacterium]|nr:2-C-methyl-D-erythritol 2,4-cyclodiphosphate synthase [Candidatus Shapirobacteria bacterium]